MAFVLKSRKNDKKKRRYAKEVYSHKIHEKNEEVISGREKNPNYYGLI